MMRLRAWTRGEYGRMGHANDWDVRREFVYDGLIMASRSCMRIGEYLTLVL